MYIFRDWPMVQNHILEHPNFNHYFYKTPDDIPWIEWELDFQQDNENSEILIPCDVLKTYEAETVFKNHANNLQLEQNKELYVFQMIKKH